MNEDIKETLDTFLMEKGNEMIRILRKEDNEYKSYSKKLQIAYNKLRAELNPEQLRQVEIIEDTYSAMNGKEMHAMYICAVKDIINLKEDNQVIKYLI